MRRAADHRPTDRVRAEVAARRLEALAADLAAGDADIVRDASVGGPPDWVTHVRQLPTAAPATTPAPAAPAASPPPRIPAPGRHAARRDGGLTRDARWSRWLPGGHRGWQPAHLAVVAVVVAVGLAVAAWWVTRERPRPEPVPIDAAAPLLEVPTGATVAGATEVAGDAGGAPAPLTVDVAGRVRRPGIVVLDPGARVVDALEAAGGARGGVDLTGINLARPLVDGEQILVGAVGAAPPSTAGAVASGVGVPAPLVNLNLATPDELEELPEVGPVTAAAIIAWRTEHGVFTSVEELLEVDGIGEKTLATLRPHVTL
ncbi:DNA-binding protein [Nocardioides sp. GY 10113]|uniref:helix-hairpin-helix domain-containing protein n=1 Tax=Nocardioides sp. GY 10113 TaxID=2569761 RepID=UPI0010A7C341|nr:helix-hairpin-helix domain-containing protein [Nocardioides sp. GY 10113]TIC84865.1 DNA-binding protein [Nocardioides sp. GY 10113]